jgi:uncharacterized membrane protein YcaP (DUF421 family)
MHWAFSGLALRWHGFGRLIKGRSQLLVRDGQVDEAALRGAHMTEHDLLEDLRGEGVPNPDHVAEARLERSGEVSVVKAHRPKVVEVSVAEGVQTVRIEIGGGSESLSGEIMRIERLLRSGAA